ncbi:MAG: carbohydrate ABC transporter permease [Clostridium sp.]|nr:carbohydrate ABC transporter permease [Clostridium sp.]
MNAIHPMAEAVAHVIIGLFALACIIPFVLVVIVSFTDEASVAINGYQFIPEKWSLAAYKTTFQSGEQLLKSYGVSIFITVVGTACSVIGTTLYAYPLYRRQFPYRKFFTFFAFFTTLFSGGLVPSYMLIRNVLGLADTIWVLILPLLVNPFNIILMRTFFTNSIPDSLVEAAAIDGCGEYRTLFQIVLPLSLPAVATIGLLNALGYWNDWFTALLYINNPNLMPLQFLLMKLERNAQFLIQNASSIGGSQLLELTKNLPVESMRMVMIVLAVLPIACAYPFFQRYFISGLTVGAVKG